MQGNDLAVDLCADAAVADVGVDLVREVERGRAGLERLDLALRREDEHLVLEQVDLEALDELLRVLQLLLPVEQRLEPLDAVLGAVAVAVAVARVLVDPVRGDPELRRLVNVMRADLDL